MLKTELPDYSGKIHITMFGEFTIESGGKKIHDSSARTHQLWHLIEYLITFRHRSVSQSELIEALWPDADIENPSNALKNLVYRIRSAFAAHKLPYSREMVIFVRGCYQWNNSLDTYVDSEAFEELYKQASMPGTGIEESIEKYVSAINLYKGDFLPGSRFESWVVPISSHYRAMYFKCVYAALELLLRLQRYAEIETICQKAMTIDQFEESIHKYLILGMIRQGKQTQALAHYGYVTDLFFRELGVNPSPSMRDLYRDIIKTMHNVETDINIVKEDLREPEVSAGAFYCEYEVFKNLYRLEARTAARTGQSVFVCLLTVNAPPNEPLDAKTRSRAMDGLFDIIKASLRKGDVFSRFSAAQYVLMLPTLTYENCVMVMDRIIKRYKQAYHTKSAEISATVQPLSPVEIAR